MNTDYYLDVVTPEGATMTEEEKATDIETGRIFQFGNATVIFKNKRSAATGCKLPSLEIQVIDQYGYQREWSLSKRWEPGDSKSLFWESHIYQHPGRKETELVSEALAKRVLRRFLYLCEKYPTLIFNDADERRARHDGFVHFAERLHRGEALSTKLL